MTRFEDATVTGVDPLRIRLDGDADPLPFTPDSLIAAAALAEGDRVRIELSERRVVLYGRADGPPVGAGLPSRLASTAGAVSAVTDWDDALESGWYSATDAANAPDGVSGLLLVEVVAHDDDYVLQRARVLSDSDDYPPRTQLERIKVDGTWSAWGSGLRLWATYRTTIAQNSAGSPGNFLALLWNSVEGSAPFALAASPNQGRVYLPKAGVWRFTGKVRTNSSGSSLSNFAYARIIKNSVTTGAAAETSENLAHMGAAGAYLTTERLVTVDNPATDYVECAWTASTAFLPLIPQTTMLMVEFVSDLEN